VYMEHVLWIHMEHVCVSIYCASKTKIISDVNNEYGMFLADKYTQCMVHRSTTTTEVCIVYPCPRVHHMWQYT
jgi:hypothetical protein